MIIRWGRRDNLTFLGRNGIGHCTGIDVSVLPSRVCVTPLTSRNQFARCDIDLPRDPQILMDVANALRQTAHVVSAENTKLISEALDILSPF